MEEYSSLVVQVAPERGRKRQRDPSKWKKNINKSQKYKKGKVPRCDCQHWHLIQRDGRGKKPKQVWRMGLF